MLRFKPRHIVVRSITMAAITLGPTIAHGAADEITPFEYHAPQSALDELKRRLGETRWPERETCKDWSEDVPLEGWRRHRRSG